MSGYRAAILDRDPGSEREDFEALQQDSIAFPPDNWIENQV